MPRPPKFTLPRFLALLQWLSTVPDSPELRDWIVQVVHDLQLDPTIFPAPIADIRNMDTSTTLGHLIAHYGSQTATWDSQHSFVVDCLIYEDVDFESMF